MVTESAAGSGRFGRGLDRQRSRKLQLRHARGEDLLCLGQGRRRQCLGQRQRERDHYASGHHGCRRSTTFTIPATASELTVAISSFTATDNVGVTGYMVTESAAAPAASTAGWSATAPASYTLLRQGPRPSMPGPRTRPAMSPPAGALPPRFQDLLL